MAVTTTTVAFGVSKGLEVKGAQEERRARREINRTQTAAGQIEDRNTKRQLARERRIQNAQIASASEAQGSENSSREIGASAVVNNQAGVNIANISRQQNTSLDISRLNQDIADARVTQQIGRELQNAAQTFASGGSGSTNSFDNLFTK